MYLSVCLCFVGQIKNSLIVDDFRHKIYETMIFVTNYDCFSYHTKRCDVPPFCHSELLVLRETTVTAGVQH